MPTHPLLQECLLSDDDLARQLASLFDSDDWLPPDPQPFREHRTVRGRIVHVGGDSVRVDIGFKSDGIVPLDEWEDHCGAIVAPRPGDELGFVLDSLDENGEVVLSYRKARLDAQWKTFLDAHAIGDEVSGKVLRRVPGGLIVEVGLCAFLPASQVDVRRPPDLGEYVGKEVQCEILAIDRRRRNVIVSRRLSRQRQNDLNRLNALTSLEAGQVRQGVVVNVVDFGAFVDLGGIDGLLHVTDMSWRRVRDTREIVQVGQRIRVHVLSVDRQRERIALSMKHLTPDPWTEIAARYPVGSRHEVEVVNLTNYGAFVELSAGVEGLVHVSEMSWGRKGVEALQRLVVGERIAVQVLRIDQGKREMCLGTKQLTPNPWDGAAHRFHNSAKPTGAERGP